MDTSAGGGHRHAPDGRDDDLVVRAAQLLATSLTHFDLDGGAETEPVLGERPDLLDTEVDPKVVARKMQIVLQRLDDPDLVPTEPAIRALVTRWVGWELLAAGVAEPAAAVARVFLDRYPLHRDAPAVQWEEAHALTLLAWAHRPQTPGESEARRREAEARARLARYIGATPWTEANRADPDALRRAEDLAKKK